MKGKQMKEIVLFCLGHIASLGLVNFLKGIGHRYNLYIYIQVPIPSLDPFHT